MAKKLKDIRSETVLIEEVVEQQAKGEPCVYLMRHGRTALDSLKRSDGWLDFPLTDEGRMELIHTQQELMDANISKIYCANLRRTSETAEIIQSGLFSHPEIVVVNALKTWHLGKLTGSKKQPNKPIVTHYIEHPDETPKGGESLMAFRDRFLPIFNSILEETKKEGACALVILSGSNLREVSYMMHGDRRVLDLDEAGLIELKPAGDKWSSKVIFGHKDDDTSWSS